MQTILSVRRPKTYIIVYTYHMTCMHYYSALHNLTRTNRKKSNETEKVNTACARAAQEAAVTSQLAQNDGHFPNPRGVDLERVSF
jgi:hypothetical protein